MSAAFGPMFAPEPVEAAPRIPLPYQWGAWDIFATRIEGFLEWAEPPPVASNESRYAIALARGFVQWVNVSPNRDEPKRWSGGGFYDDVEDHPEGAVEWCRASALLAKAETKALLERVDAAVADQRRSRAEWAALTGAQRAEHDASVRAQRDADARSRRPT